MQKPKYITVWIRGVFIRVHIPNFLWAERERASRLSEAVWDPREKSWFYPLCRECYEEIREAFSSQTLEFPKLRIRDLPSLAKWVAQRADPSTIIKSVDEIGKDDLTEQSLQLEIPWELSGGIESDNFAPRIVAELLEVEQELISYFATRPERLQSIEPQVFEKLILAIYRNHGFDVSPIGAWNQQDGGVDILAVYKSFGINELRLAIQCKCSKHNISAAPIRQLAGVLDRFRAHQGVLCTTSYFTAQAITETRHSLWRISLEDRTAIFSKLRRLHF